MGRAYGSRAQLLGKTESVYGTAPSGNWAKLGFISSNLGSEQGLIASEVLGYGRDPISPFQDVINHGGDIVIPVDVRNIGFWLTGLLGLATDTGASDPYTHTFSSGGASLPSRALEIGMPEVPAYFVHTGVLVGSMAFSFARSGAAQCTVNLLGQKETRGGSTSGGTPTVATYTPFSQFQGAIKKDGSALANVTAATLTYANGLEAVPAIRSDGLIDGIDPAMASCNGTIDARFADTTLLAAAESSTTCSIELSYTISANRKLTLLVNQVRLPKPKIAVAGPGGIQASFAWQGFQIAGSSAMLTATLINDVSAYS